MSVGSDTAATPILLERSAELDEVGWLVGEVVGGGHGVLLVEGPAGIGKTSVLDAAVAQASAAGLGVLAARGGELEREFPFGVALQLFEPVLHSAEPEVSAALLEGAAALVAPTLGLPSAQPADASPFAAVHGLYWLCVNLAQRAPVLLVVDDLHWCDEQSLRWLSYLARRIEGVPVGIVLAARPAEPGGARELVAELENERGVRRIALETLSTAAGTELVRHILGPDVDDLFGAACHDAGAGNPLLIGELARAVAQAGMAPDAGNAPAVADVAPESIVHAMLLRLGRLAPEAVALARAVAVLGHGVALPTTAALAGVSPADASELAGALADARIFTRTPGLDFIHPVVRTALYMDMAPAPRAEMHARAADVLAAQHADAEAIAQHVLASAPGSAPQHVGVLRDAAAAAAGRGAPDAAIRLLRRALDEPHEGEAAELLYALGRLEAEAGDPAGLDHLRAAVLTEEAPLLLRGVAAKSLVHSLAPLGRGHEVRDVVDEAFVDALAEVDAELALRLEAELVSAGVMAGSPQRFPASGPAAERGATTLGEREVLGAMALTAPTVGEASDLAERALGYGTLLPGQLGSQSMAFYVVLKLILCGGLELADTVLDQLIADARDRASFFDLGRYGNLRGLVAYRAGRLAEAAAEARAAFEIALEGGWDLGVATTLSVLIDALRERGQWDVAQQAIDEARLEGRTLGVGQFIVESSRARLEIAQGQAQAGIQRLERIVYIVESGWTLDPQMLEIRVTLATVFAGSGDRDRAQAEANAGLESARVWGEPRAIGVALVAAGLAAGGTEGLELLCEARATITDGAPLEQARACVELGAALRRAKERVASREPLRAGLDLAQRCGATVLADRALEELRATGARPRRVQLSGVESLTASEFRIASLAADGLSNPAIAQQLFVTRKTVENHMTHVFQKLDLTSRDQLDAVLPNRLRAVSP